ncbi:MAG: cache domain-containing protein, partial [Deltaproteobacteria bacterium]|nr:cache domain-containing protein [Deltaproteobacteria bacterium]
MVWGLGLLALALLINTVAGSLYTRRGMRESTARSQNEVALFTALRMETFLRREVEGLKVAGAAMMLFPLGGEEQRRLAGLLLQNDGSIDEIAILDRFGQAVLWLTAGKSNPPVRFREFRDSPEFLTAAAGKYFIKATPAARPSEPSWVTLAVPLVGSEGAIAGALMARAKLDFLRQAIDDVKFGHHGSAYVIDDSGLLIAHSDPSYALVKRNLR